MKKEEKQLTKQQKRAEMRKRKFIEVYLECGNATEAYQKVYKCLRSTASARGHELLKTIPMEDILELAGVTDELLTTKIKEGLQSTRPYGKDAFIAADYATRHAYLTTALKIKRRIDQTENKQPIMQGLQIVINK